MLRIGWVISIFLYSICSYAVPNYFFSNSFKIIERPCLQNKKCVSLNHAEGKIGYLVWSPKTPNSFEFFDEFDNRQIIIKRIPDLHQTRRPCIATFELYDNNQQLIANVRTDAHSKYSFDGFDLYNKDFNQHLLHAAASLWGDNTTIYDAASLWGDNTTIYDALNKKQNNLISIKRQYFTSSHDSEVFILKPTTLQLLVDPNILAATLALYTSTELRYYYEPPIEKLNPRLLLRLRNKLEVVAKSKNLLSDLYAKIDPTKLQATETLLNQRYLEVYGDDKWNTPETRIEQTCALGIELILSHTLSIEEEKALLQILINKIYS